MPDLPLAYLVTFRCYGMSLRFAIENGFADAVPPDRVLNALKANATRELRQDGHWTARHSPWVDGEANDTFGRHSALSKAKRYV